VAWNEVNLEKFDAYGNGNDINFDFSAPKMQSLDPSPIVGCRKRKKYKVVKNKETKHRA